MKLTYYGTSAGGGIPEIFCSCRVCQHARQNRGKNIRTRSQAVLDDKLSIDYSVDTFMHTLYYGLDMRKITHVLITHDHHDHFLPADVLSRHQGMTEPVNFYAGERSGRVLKTEADKREADFASGKRVRTCSFVCKVHVLEFFTPTKILDYNVIPLKARHAEQLDSMIYIIQKEGKSILWAHDTGLFCDETWQYIENSGIVFDFVSLDCTLERGKIITTAHMDIEQCKIVMDRLKTSGNATDKTVGVVSHIGHLVNRTHDELKREAAELGLLVAYDGMTVEI